MRSTKLTAIAATAVIAVLLNACKKNDEVVEPEKPAPVRPITAQSTPFISQVFEYTPAPGQFVNTDSYGTVAKAKELIGGIDNGLVSLGSFGGYMIFGFDHSILNAEGADIGIYGNPLYKSGMEWSEAGIVMVMQDKNGNGLPDDGEWYELAGSEYNNPETIKKYKITYSNPKNLTDDIRWTDNQGKSGVVLRNRYHSQAYYPTWVSNQESITFEGTLLRNTLVAGGIITNKPFEWGYSDTGSADYVKMMDEEGRAYNSFDISWAVDKNGNKVKLGHIDFVKVYTGQNSNGNPFPDLTNPKARMLGEVSTEIGGAIDISLSKKPATK